jgi:hypothetical protein
VWSKVISGLILGVIATVWLWAKSGFSTNLAIAWAASNAALRALWDWLSRPLGMSRGLALLLVVLISAGIIELVRRIRVAHAARLEAMRLLQESTNGQLHIETRSHAVDVARLTDERIAIEEKLREITERFTQADRARANLIDELAESSKPLPSKESATQADQYNLNENQIRVMQMLFKSYTTRFRVDAIAGALRISYPAAERLKDELKSKKLVALVRGGYSSQSGYVLTEEGRNYCLDKGY